MAPTTRNTWRAAAAVVLCAGTALGQYRDLAVQNNNPSSRNFSAEFRSRNSVIYGTAPGGQSFRGNLGYRDPGEFQGYLGSNNLYDFRRNSAYSGAGGQGVRSSDLLAYKAGLATGNSGGVSPVGDYLSSIPRSFDNIPKQQLLDQRNAFGNSSARYTQLVRAAYMADQVKETRDVQQQMGRSAITNSREGDYLNSQVLLGRYLETQSYGRDRSVMKPQYLETESRRGMFGLRRERYRPSSSGYAGYDAFQSTRVYDQQTLITYEERANSQRDLLERLGTPLDAVEARQRRLDQTMQKQGGFGASTVTPHEELQRRLEDESKKRYENQLAPTDRRPDDRGLELPGARPESQQPGALPGDPMARPGEAQGVGDVQSRLESLRTNLRSDYYRKDTASLLTRPNMESPLSSARRTSARELLAAKKDPLAEYNATDRPTSRDRDRATERETDTETARDLAGARIDPETLRMIRDAGGKVDTLIPAGVAGRDLYAENIAIGEEMMRASRFFDADDRFTRAMSFKPGDVTAGVGRIHAQLGAGLYASAGTGVRSLFSEHPEVIAQRYTGAVRPDERRSKVIIEQLRATASPNSPTEDAVRREAALLLAYTGFQVGDRQAVTDGLAEMNRLAPTEPITHAREAYERLAGLLSGIWLDEKFYKDPSGAAPAPLDPAVPAGK